jgi:hypothetical protein
MTPAPFDLAVAITILDHLPVADIAPTVNWLALALKPGGAAIVKVHTVDDPGADSDQENSAASGLASMIQHYFEPGELQERLARRLDVVNYTERKEEDTSHGEPHQHAFAIALAVKPFTT